MCVCWGEMLNAPSPTPAETSFAFLLRIILMTEHSSFDCGDEGVPSRLRNGAAACLTNYRAKKLPSTPRIRLALPVRVTIANASPQLLLRAEVQHELKMQLDPDKV